MLSVSNKRYVVICLVLLLVGFWLVFPRTPNLDSIQEVIHRGEYQVAARELKRALDRDPDWHEARALLVLVELAQGNGEDAQKHIRLMAGPDALQDVMDEWIKGELSEEQVNAVLGLQDLWDEYPHWLWLREIGFKVLNHRDRMEQIPGYVESLGEEDFLSLSGEIKVVWQRVITSRRFSIAWDLATVLDTHPRGLDLDVLGERFRGLYDLTPGRAYREYIMIHSDMTPEVIARLQTEYPQDAYLAATTAWGMEAREALDWLASWEQEYEIEDNLKELYSSYKSIVVERLPAIQQRDLEHILPVDILRAGLGDWQNTEKLEFLLEYLKQFPELQEELTLAGQVRKPEILLSKENVNWASMPGPEWVISQAAYEGAEYAGEVEIYNLETGTSFFELSDLRYLASPDGERLVVFDTVQNVRVYDNRGMLLKSLYLEDEGFIPLGWRDNHRVWLQQSKVNKQGFMESSLAIWDLRDSSLIVKKEDTGGNQFWSIGSNGKVAWLDYTMLWLYDDSTGKTFSTSGEGILSIRGWQPNGHKLLVQRGEKGYLVDMEGDSKEISVDRVIGWRSETEVYFRKSIIYGREMLAYYNLLTGETTLTGVMSPLSVQGNAAMFLDFRSQKLTVYGIE